MKIAMLILLSACCADLAFAQTPLRVQPVVKIDPCAGADAEDLASCGMEALGDKDYDAARRAWMLASQHGDYLAARWLGEIYSAGKGVKTDYLQAYEWFDIAAALHARAIVREHPAEDWAARDSNQGEIDHRNAIAKKLKADQIKQAQHLSLKWQAANPHAVEEQEIFAE
jgi:TPR repeat protein